MDYWRNDYLGHLGGKRRLGCAKLDEITVIQKRICSQSYFASSFESDLLLGVRELYVEGFCHILSGWHDGSLLVILNFKGEV
jgi:hypothetical protein